MDLALFLPIPVFPAHCFPNLFCQVHHRHRSHGPCAFPADPSLPCALLSQSLLPSTSSSSISWTLRFSCRSQSSLRIAFPISFAKYIIVIDLMDLALFLPIPVFPAHCFPNLFCQ